MGIFKKTYYTVEYDKLQGNNVFKDARMGKVLKLNPKEVPIRGFGVLKSPEKGWVHITVFFTDKELALARVKVVQRQEEKNRELIEEAKIDAVAVCDRLSPLGFWGER